MFLFPAHISMLVYEAENVNICGLPAFWLQDAGC